MRRVNFTGEQIGPYFVRERIGQGGMADVYRAYQPSVKREVALKVIPLLASAEHEQLRQRFKQEAEMIAGLEHPHILPVFDYGVSGDVLYLAMRLLRGGTVRDLLVQQNALPPHHAADLVNQFATALGYAHRRGIIHRDLKPSNILLDDEQNAYLADFGLAKVLGGSSQLTTTGSIIGTPAYMSPEQLRGDPINHRSDIYSLGVILYHMLVGRPPFEALTTFSLIYQHVEKMPPPPREFNPDISPAIETVLLRALQKNPDDRFESAEHVAHALEVAIGRKPAVELDDTPVPDVVVSQQALAPPVTEGPSIPSSDTIPQVQPSQTDSTGPIALARRGRSSGLFLGIMAAIIVLVTIGLLVIQQADQASVIPPPTVLAGQEGSPEDLTPTNHEISLAQRAMTDDGFIAYITCNQTSQFFATQARRITEAAGRYGFSVRVYDSNTDSNEEIIQIERARTEGAKALVVCVVDANVVSDTLESVQEAGMPLVLHNIGEPPTYGGVLITHDDYALGYAPGRYAGELVADEMGGRANVIILDFPELPSIVERADGLEDGFLSAAPDANIVGRYKGGTPVFASEAVQDLLADGVDIDVILSINDVGAYGAIDVLEEAGIGPDEVIITGVDSEAVATQHVRDGYYFRATLGVAEDQVPLATVHAIVKLMSGSTVPQIINVPIRELVTAESLNP
jgi:serine/threonine protein kinase/ABC-type sugar transport system substrate-binding protein